MGNLNEIQKQTTQSYGDNSFTTTIKENTVEFDSAKDSFTFNDEVNVPGLKVNGQEITRQTERTFHLNIYRLNNPKKSCINS